MSHVTPPLVCIWSGHELQVTRISDDVGHDWVEHVYPGRDGAELESMGARPRRFDLEALFMGVTWREDALDFLTQVQEAPTIADFDLDEMTQITTLIHPWWGSISGAMGQARVTHEDRVHSSARITCTFVEGTAAPFAFEASASLPAAVAGAEAAHAGASAALAALGA